MPVTKDHPGRSALGHIARYVLRAGVERVWLRDLDCSQLPGPGELLRIVNLQAVAQNSRAWIDIGSSAIRAEAIDRWWPSDARALASSSGARTARRRARPTS